MRKLLSLVLLALTIAVGNAQSVSQPAGTARRIVRAASLPATCTVGDVYFKTAATVGTYQCLTTNAWTAMGGGGGASPAGSAVTDANCWASASTFGVCSKIYLTGTPTSTVSQIYAGPNESTLPALIQGYASPASLLVTRTYNSPSGVNIGAEYSGGGTGVFVVGVSTAAGSNPFGNEADMYAGADGAVPVGFYSFCGANGFHATECDGFYVQTPDATGGLDISQAFYAKAQGGAATNAFVLWGDDTGVYAIHAINTFNAVYQDRPALYNPQFTKFTPGATDQERVVQQWESNEAWLRTEAGGTGTLRRLGLGSAGLDVSSGDVANPFTLAKTTVSAAAPGAGKVDLRIVQGTGSTCNLVMNAGTSATEVVVVANVGGGC